MAAAHLPFLRIIAKSIRLPRAKVSVAVPKTSGHHSAGAGTGEPSCTPGGMMKSHARSTRPPSRRRRGRLTAAAVAFVAVIATATAWLALKNSSADESVSANLPTAASGLTAPQAASTDAVTELDKTFLTKVRQAGLWEIPAGRLAQTNASSEAIKRAGLHLLEGHSKLDQLVREDSQALQVPIPDLATAEQQAWVDQLRKARGSNFDQLFVDLLRASHGKVFITIGEVRASTKNSVVRRLAAQANTTVQDHMDVLEDTGLVTDAILDDVASTIPK
ncbi:DUF4142 domain-containing protein [Streptomyces virginiae]|uniref:DUF4142 domain-containing protein n=1 Tax=Streptomyces TaxID=1883 RepID=UPI002079C527|nr:MULTISPECIES: DUF4142 domain-containing protein [Streptomyces]MCM9083078.1 DUF4142 domain-containing protein [Streptomyces spororaveus]MCX4717185.1 DUF4142 domain-containing protein [Streptomyces virginiae]